MTKTEALYNFWSQFGMDAYPSNTVPDDVVFPWLTYEPTVGNPGDDAVATTVNLYFHTDSEKVPNAKAEQIAQAIGRGGVQVPYTGGSIWIKRGEPWCLSIVNENDQSIRQRSLNIYYDFL